MARKPEVKVQISSDSSGAQKGFKELGDHADGLGGKLGKIGGAAAVGGAALGAFAVEGVLKFQDLGLEVDKLHNATGLSYDSASRLTEVFGDIGISSEDVGASIGKMEKKLGANKDAFDKYGVSVKYAKDGTVDANETFLNAIDALHKIDDPTKRAAAGADIFGKSWATMSEAINMDGAELRANLAGVSDAKIFDEEKIKQAKDLRAAFDQIKDAGEDLLLTVGHALAPVIAKLAPTLAKVVAAAEPLAVAIGDVLGPALEAIGPIISALMPVIEALATALSSVGKAAEWAMGPHSEGAKALKTYSESLTDLKVKAEKAGISSDDFGKMVHDAAQEAKDNGSKGMNVFGDSIGILDGKLLAATDRTASWSESAKIMFERSGHAKKGLDDVGNAAKDAAPKMSAFDQTVKNADQSYQHLIGILDEKDAWANAQAQWMTFKGNAEATDQDVRDATRSLAEFVKNADSIPAEKKTKFYAELDKGQLDLVEQQLAILSRNRDVNLNIIAKGGAGYGTGKAFAHGTNNAPPGTALVGEYGPELVEFGGGEKVKTAAQTARMFGGGVTNVYQNFPAGTRPEDVVNAQRLYKRRNGST